MVGHPLSLLVSLLLLLAPSAAAAVGLTVTSSPEDPLAPETETGNIDLTVVVDCTSLALRTIEDPAGMMATEGTVAVLELTAPDGVSISGSGSISVPACEAGAETTNGSGSLDVVLSRDLPGYNDYNIEIAATIPESELDPDPNSDSATATVPSGFYGLIQAQVEEKIMETTGGDVVFQVTLSNHGNTAVQVTPALISTDPEDAADWFTGADPTDLPIGVPEPMTEDIALPFQVSTGPRLQATFTFEFTGTHPSEEGSADPTTLSLVVRRLGGEEESPGPGALLSLASLALAGAFLRRRA